MISTCQAPSIRFQALIERGGIMQGAVYAGKRP